MLKHKQNIAFRYIPSLNYPTRFLVSALFDGFGWRLGTRHATVSSQCRSISWASKAAEPFYEDPHDNSSEIYRMQTKIRLLNGRFYIHLSAGEFQSKVYKLWTRYSVRQTDEVLCTDPSLPRYIGPKLWRQLYLVYN